MNYTCKLILIAAAVLISQSSVFGRWNDNFGKRGGPPGRRPHGPPLPFLKGLNMTDVKEFLNIRRNDNLTKAQVQQQEDAWADKHNSTIQSIYNEFKANRTKFEQEFKANITKAAANLTVDARAVFDELEKVKDNQNISYRQEHEQIRSILKGTTPEIRKELKKIMPRPPHGRGGHKGHGKHGGRKGPGGPGGPGDMDNVDKVLGDPMAKEMQETSDEQ